MAGQAQYAPLHGSASLADVDVEDALQLSESDILSSSSSSDSDSSFEIEAGRSTQPPQFVRRLPNVAAAPRHIDPLAEPPSAPDAQTSAGQPNRRVRFADEMQPSRGISAPVPPGALRVDSDPPASASTKSRPRSATAGRLVGRKAREAALADAKQDEEEMSFVAEFNPVDTTRHGGEPHRQASDPRPSKVSTWVADDDVFDDVQDDMQPRVPPVQSDDPMSSSHRSVKYRIEAHDKYHDDVSQTVRQRKKGVDTDTEETTVQPEAPAISCFTVLWNWLHENSLAAQLHTLDKTYLYLGNVVLVVLFLAGLAVFCFGIASLARPNARQIHVDAFNYHVAAFESDPVQPATMGRAAVENMTASVSEGDTGEPVRLQHVAGVVEPFGVTEGVHTGTTAFLEGMVTIPSSRQVTLVFNVVLQPFNTPLAVSRSFLTTVSADDQPPERAITSQTEAGLGDRYSLSEVCIVVGLQSDGSIRVDGKKSCYYDFSDWQRYSPPSEVGVRIPVRIRIDGDPFLSLQEETKGSLDFAGETRYQQRLRGGMSLTVGIVAICLFGSLLLHTALEASARRYRFRAARRSTGSWIRDPVRKAADAGRSPDPPGRPGQRRPRSRASGKSSR